MPTVLNLGRAANAFRHKSRPRNPTDLTSNCSTSTFRQEFQDEGMTKDIIVSKNRSGTGLAFLPVDDVSAWRTSKRSRQTR